MYSIVEHYSGICSVQNVAHAAISSNLQLQSECVKSFKIAHIYKLRLINAADKDKLTTT